MGLMTKAEFEQRWEALRARFAYQFYGQHIGHDIMPGWLGLAERLFTGVDAVLNDAEKKHFTWFQIKEKFGGLRTYPRDSSTIVDIVSEDGYDRVEREPGPAVLRAETWGKIAALIEVAEEEADRTCSSCGAPGTLRRDRPWMATLCDLCARRKSRFRE